MGLWERLLSAVGRAAASVPVEAPPPAPARTGSDDEATVRALLERLTVATPDAADLDLLGSPALLGAVDRLVDQAEGQGEGGPGLELLRRLVALDPALHRAPRALAALRARLGRLLVERLDHAGAVAALGPLEGDAEHGALARFVLAEAAERSGDARAAARHYERVLALDLDYPRARARLSRLVGEAASVAPAPTLAGLEIDRTAVGDRFRLRAELGRGGSSTVYLAHDVELDRDCALKLLHPQATARATAETRRRAWSEARVAAGLRHPGVVTILDLDEERGLIAMELCAGGTLRERLARGPLAPATALGFARSLLGTVAAVHEAGVVHRDLKPGNLLLRPVPRLDDERDGRAPLPDDELVVGDFGLALLDGSGGSEAPAGTLRYLAPEARRGEPGAPSDVFACGVVIADLLAAAAPPVEESAAAGRAADLVRRLVAEDPRDRPTAAEAARALAT